MSHQNPYLDILKTSTDSKSRYFIQKFAITPEKFADWRWQMKHQITSLESFANYFPLSPNQATGLEHSQKYFNVGITPYYLSLMEPRLSENCPIKIQALPQELETLEQSSLVADPLDEVPHSPVKEVVHLYPDRVAFCVAQICPVYCRYCFRKRRDEERGLHFNRRIVQQGVDYISSNPAIRDVLITGGDPFLASDESLENLLKKLRAIPHVEIIRFGTRTPVTLPYRITPELCEILRRFHPLWVNTHFNCAEEFTPEAELSLSLLADAGIPLGNQSVLLKGVNDSNDKMLELCRNLVKNRVRPYYVFHAHLIEGTGHLRVSLELGQKIMRSLQGNISGFGIPRFIVDTPSGKVPVDYNYQLKREGKDLILEDPRGEVWRELNAFF